MAEDRVTTIAVEVGRQEASRTRVSQLVTEVMRADESRTRVSQLVVEVLRESSAGAAGGAAVQVFVAC